MLSHHRLLPLLCLPCLCASAMAWSGCSGDAVDDEAADAGPAKVTRLPQFAIGTKQEDDLQAIAVTKDGDLMAAGYTNGAGAGDWDALLLRASPCGELRWAKTYGGVDKEMAVGVVATADGGLAAVGRTDSFGGYVDVYVLRTDGQGVLQWSYAYGGSGHDAGVAIVENPDGSLLALAETYNFGPGTPAFHNMMLLKLGATGELLWDRTFGGDVEGDAGFAIAHRFGADGGHLGHAIAGATESYGQGRDDVWLLYVDDAGALAGSWAYGGPGDDEARAISPTADGGWLITGHTRGFDAQSADIFALEVGAKGEVRWMRRYGGTKKERSYGIHPISEAGGGGWMLTGHSASFGQGLDDRLALRLDAAGKPVKLRVFGMKADDKSEASVALGGDRFVLAGRTESLGAGQRDGWITTVDADAMGGCLETTVPPSELRTAGLLPERVLVEPGMAQGAVRSDADTVVGDFAAPVVQTKDTCPTACE